MKVFNKIIVEIEKLNQTLNIFFKLLRKLVFNNIYY